MSGRNAGAGVFGIVRHMKNGSCGVLLNTVVDTLYNRV